MTRAEKAALKAYPKSEGIRELKGLSARPIFIQGYKQAEKDTRKGLLVWAKKKVAYYKDMLKKYPNDREYMAFVGAYQNMIEKLKKI